MSLGSNFSTGEPSMDGMRELSKLWALEALKQTTVEDAMPIDGDIARARLLGWS